jgi:hypothetical protein
VFDRKQQQPIFDSIKSDQNEAVRNMRLEIDSQAMFPDGGRAPDTSSHPSSPQCTEGPNAANSAAAACDCKPTCVVHPCSLPSICVSSIYPVCAICGVIVLHSFKDQRASMHQQMQGRPFPDYSKLVNALEHSF